MMMMIQWIFLLLLLCICHTYAGRINVILMGASGNLAEKYLWQSLYNIHSKGLDNPADQIFVFPAATKKASDNAPIVARILENNVTWRHDDDSKNAFMSRISPYVQLRSEDNYETLATLINNLQEEANEDEVGRLFYLSVPPKFFGSISKLVSKHLRPKNEKAWFRVIVEKPFGVDYESAKSLADEMYSSLSNEEIFLVDHYMGKVGMLSIRHFVKNHNWVDFLGNRKITKIEAGMLETEDCKGRTGFYDDVGVIRDTLQNHVTQMVAILAMDPKRASDNEPTARKEILQKLSRAVSSRVVKIGQYAAYNDHVNEDREKWGEAKLENPSKTVTYAHVVLGLDDPQHVMHNVPIHFVSGKALDERQSYVDVELDNGDNLLFNFQGSKGQVKGAAVFISGTPSTSVKGLEGWQEHSTPTGMLLQAPESPNAYEVLLRAALEGHQEHFVKLDEVLESWQVWTPLLKELETSFDDIHSYSHGTNLLSDQSVSNKVETRDEL